MTESVQTGFTPEELRHLRRVRGLAERLQEALAPLAADLQSDAYSEQFNQLRLEAKALLKDPDFDQKVPRAITEELWASRSQRTIFPRLSMLTFLGVILALVGLGVNSIVLDDVLVNSVGCCISSVGMLLVLGSFGVWGLVNTRRRITNLGDLYQWCESLLDQVDQTLNTAAPDPEARPVADMPQIPSAAELILDALRAQVAHWQATLRDLESQRLALGPETPAELDTDIDFARQELDRILQEINQLQDGAQAPAAARVIIPPGGRPETPPVRPEFDSQAVARARSNTMEMPVVEPEDNPEPAEGQEPPADTEEER
jgi:hypothetical protein